MLSVAVLLRILACGLALHVRNENGTDVTTVEILFLRGSDYIENETRLVVEMAEGALRTQGRVPDGLEFNIIDISACSGSGEAQAFEPVHHATQHYFCGSEPLDLIMGPHCSPGMRYVGRLATDWNLPIVGYNSVNAEFAQRETYPTLSRVSITLSSLADATMVLLRHLNITQLAIVKDPSNVAAMMLYSGIANALKNSEIKVNIDVNVTIKEPKTIPAALEQLKANARIIILNVAYYTDSTFMAALTEHNMTGPEYFFIIPSGAGFFSPGNLVSEEVNLALSKSFVVHAEGIDAESVAAFSKRMQVEKGAELGYEGFRRSQIFFRTRYPIIHDSFYFYMWVASQLFAANKSHILRDGLKFWKYLPNRNFIGASGRVWIDNNADRLPNYVIDTVDGDTIKRAYRLDVMPVCEGKCVENEGQLIGKIQYKWVPKQLWPEHKGLPPDIPECGFRGELCDKTIMYLTVCLVLVATVLGALGFRMRKKMKEEILHKMPWRVHPDQMAAIKKDLMGSIVTIKSERSLSEGPNPSLTLVGRDLCTVTVHQQDKAAQFSRDTLATLNELKKMQHENLSAFVGLCFDAGDKQLQVLWTTGSRGSLEGLEFIHNSSIVSHGRLNISTCYVTLQWMVKLSHFGTQGVLADLCQKSVITYEKWNLKELIHVAPEHLCQNKDLDTPLSCSHKGDIYSLGLVIYQILYRTAPYSNAEAVLNQILAEKGDVEKPKIPEKSLIKNANLRNLQACWNPAPDWRPTLGALKNMPTALSPARGGLVDNMLKMMERYAGNLERLVRERTALLEDAQKQADILLFRMLPQTIALDLKAGKAVEPQLFKSATVSFTDIVGFTPLCSKSTPLQIVSFLNTLFSRYDEIIESHDAYKVETIGDAYLVVSGLPNQNGERHAHEICSIALSMRQCARNFKLSHLSEELKIRIGIDSGSVAAGVIGITAPRYCIFGDTVNTASRMESTGEAMKIQMSQDAKVLVEQWSDKFSVQERGQVSVKGKGQLMVYWLEGVDQ